MSTSTSTTGYIGKHLCLRRANDLMSSETLGAEIKSAEGSKNSDHAELQHIEAVWVGACSPRLLEGWQVQVSARLNELSYTYLQTVTLYSGLVSTLETRSPKLRSSTPSLVSAR